MMKQVILKELECPITHEMMVDPVMAADGHTYDRPSIERWFAAHNTSPLTGARLETKKLTPVYSLRNLVDKYLTSKQIEARRLANQTREIESKSADQIAPTQLQEQYPEEYHTLWDCCKKSALKIIFLIIKST